jgi:broad specificity phosphatase PhoE
MELPAVYLARHGETAWSLSGQHTGLTDLPLTPHGELNAKQLGKRLRGIKFDRVFVSPLQRARQTCKLAGFDHLAEVDADLVEWNYGDYEGKTTAEIRIQRADWKVFRDGCPGGESVADVSARADRVITKWRALGGQTLVFSSGHFLRAVGARWLGLEAGAGRFFHLSTAALSALGYEHTLAEPVMRWWNDERHASSQGG